MKNVLIVFVKNAVAGKVKTRLAADIGNEEALEVYKKLILRTQVTLTDIECERQIWFSQEIPDDPAWGLCAEKKRVQSGSGLGERMAAAIEQNFEEGAERVVIIGSDCAELKAKHIEHAHLLLESYELVLGPALDGGYYLLGMNSYHKELFEDIEWSTSEVLDRTIAKAEDKGLEYIQLEPLRDVDTIEDWEIVKNDLFT